MMNKPPKEFVIGRSALMRSMQYVVTKMDSSGYYRTQIQAIKNVVASIKKNTYKHFLCSKPPQDFAVTYAKDMESPFDSNKRVSTTLGRYIRRQLEVSDKVISDAILDAFCNYYNSYMKYVVEANEGDFKILYGKDLLAFYKKVTGKFASCMAGENYFRVEIYAMNPDKVSLLTYKEEGRALLWNCEDGIKYMDRVYCVTKYSSLFDFWAADNGYTTYNNMPQKAMKVNLKYGRYLPSIDTFYNVKYDLENKTVLACSHEFTGSKRTSLDNLCPPGMEPLKCFYKQCGKVLPDEDEYKTKRGTPVCPKCKELLGACIHCKNDESIIGDYDLCGDCEKELIRRCANHVCGKRANKLEMIKMKRPNAIKICFACGSNCMKVVNPDWHITTTT